VARRKLTEEEKIEKVRLENEKRIADLLETSKKDLLNNAFIHEPTIQWEVGERVYLGSINKSIITEVLGKGKVIKLHCTSVNGANSQNPGYVSEKDMYVAWHDIAKYRSKAENAKLESFSVEEDVFVNFSNRCINDLVHSMYFHFGIDMDQDYQRGHVWELEDKQKLIESMFNNIDIGKVVLIHRDYGDEKLYEMLDGKQRLTAFIEFKERRFSYKGKFWDDLSWKDQARLENYLVAVGEIRSRGSKALSKAQKYKAFLKLNTAGKPQEKCHIDYVEKLLKKESK